MKLTEVDDSSGAPVYEIGYDTEVGFTVYLVGKGNELGSFATFADAEALIKMAVAGGTFSYDRYGKRLYKPVPKEQNGG